MCMRDTDIQRERERVWDSERECVWDRERVIV